MEKDKCKCEEKHDEKCTCSEKCECHEPKKNKHKEEIGKLKEENKKLEQDVLLAKADLINYRKRKDEEVARMLKFSNEDLVKELLPTIDNFERAI